MIRLRHLTIVGLCAIFGLAALFYAPPTSATTDRYNCHLALLGTMMACEGRRESVRKYDDCVIDRMSVFEYDYPTEYDGSDGDFICKVDVDVRPGDEKLKALEEKWGRVQGR